MRADPSDHDTLGKILLVSSRRTVCFNTGKTKIKYNNPNEVGVDMNFFNFLQFFNPFYWWNQMFPPPQEPQPIIQSEPEPEDPQDFDPDEEDME